jgi:glyoxylase-like metal-dependent hydrolase (beta-lactamase superfamily II)
MPPLFLQEFEPREYEGCVNAGGCKARVMQIGDYRVEIIPDTEFRLDGGAMFGVVPRVLWERVCPPDEKNRIRLNMNCVFIDTGKERILIETGIGEKWSAKETEMYGIFREKPFAESLHEITGHSPEDITIVINTHLHFDHAGGNTILPGSPPYKGGVAAASADGVVLSPNGKPQPQFPNARYLVSKSEFAHAQNPHDRDRASYLPENWRPVQESGQLELMPDDYEPAPDLKIQTVRGHSETMQTWRLDRGGQTMYGFADLIPTRHHLPLPWIMGYDLYPTETLEFKKNILPTGVNEEWLCLFYHDFDQPLCRLTQLDGRISAENYKYETQ